MHSLGISQVDDVPPRRAETPAELAAAHHKDAEMMKQVLMEFMVEDGLPVMKAEEAEQSDQLQWAKLCGDVGL
jgi:hypothetical protein